MEEKNILEQRLMVVLRQIESRHDLKSYEKSYCQKYARFILGQRPTVPHPVERVVANIDRVTKLVKDGESPQYVELRVDRSEELNQWLCKIAEVEYRQPQDMGCI